MQRSCPRASGALPQRRSWRRCRCNRLVAGRRTAHRRRQPVARARGGSPRRHRRAAPRRRDALVRRAPPGHKHRDDGVLIRGREVVDRRVIAQTDRAMRDERRIGPAFGCRFGGWPVGRHRAQQGRLDAAEGEIGGAIRAGVREWQTRRVAQRGSARDRRAAGIPEAEQARTLIECLPRGVVQRAAEQPIVQ